MSSSVQFKHVNGRDGKVESICMKCLLAAGICSSDEELATKERQHHCNERTGEIGPSRFEVADRPKSRFVWTWKTCVNPPATEANTSLLDGHT